MIMFVEEKETFKLINELKNPDSKISRWLSSDYDPPIYATKYGRSYEKDQEIIRLHKNEIKLVLNDGRFAFCYIWGWPGPDYNSYFFDDYGITWSFDEDDFKKFSNGGIKT